MECLFRGFFTEKHLYEYNKQGYLKKIITETDPDNSFIEYSYNHLNQIIRRSQGQGDSIYLESSYIYNEQNLISSISYDVANPGFQIELFTKQFINYSGTDYYQ